MYQTFLLGWVLLLASISLTAVQPVSAQATALDSLAPIRVEQTGHARWLTGRLVAADSQALTIKYKGNLLEVPSSLMARVDVSVGYVPPKARVRRGAKRGFVIGAAISGVLLGLAVGVDLTAECDDCMLPASAVALGVSLPLTVSTTAAGAFFGALSSGERWRRVSLPLEVRSSRSAPARER